MGVLLGLEQIEGDECFGAEMLPFRCPLREIRIHFTRTVVQDRRVEMPIGFDFIEEVGGDVFVLLLVALTIDGSVRVV